MIATACEVSTACVEMIAEWAEPRREPPVARLAFTVVAGSAALIAATLIQNHRRNHP